jgi:hypothetical protein
VVAAGGSPFPRGNPAMSLSFNGGANQTCYDVSDIEGHNASMTI